jgi:hypothetical protein
MRDRNDPEHRKGTDESRGRSIWGENTGDLRRRRTLNLVRRRTTEVIELLERAVPGLTLLSGAATCAEVSIDDRETTHRFVKMNLLAPASAIEGVVAVLRRDGWRRSVPGTDGGIIRIAHAHGRRPLFVLLGDDDELTGPHAPAAASPAGRAIRESRLRRASVPPVAVLATSRERATGVGLEIETLELQLRPLQGDDRPGHA